MEINKQQNKNAHRQEGMKHKNSFLGLPMDVLRTLLAPTMSLLLVIFVKYVLAEERFNIPVSVVIVISIFVSLISLIFFAVFTIKMRATRRSQAIRELKAKNQSFFETIRLDMNHLIGKESKNAGPAIGSFE